MKYIEVPVLSISNLSYDVGTKIIYKLNNEQAVISEILDYSFTPKEFDKDVLAITISLPNEKQITISEDNKFILGIPKDENISINTIIPISSVSNYLLIDRRKLDENIDLNFDFSVLVDIKNREDFDNDDEYMEYLFDVFNERLHNNELPKPQYFKSDMSLSKEFLDKSFGFFFVFDDEIDNNNKFVYPSILYLNKKVLRDKYFTLYEMLHEMAHVYDSKHYPNMFPSLDDKHSPGWREGMAKMKMNPNTDRLDRSNRWNNLINKEKPILENSKLETVEVDDNVVYIDSKYNTVKFGKVIEIKYLSGIKTCKIITIDRCIYYSQKQLYKPEKEENIKINKILTKEKIESIKQENTSSGYKKVFEYFRDVIKSNLNNSGIKFDSLNLDENNKEKIKETIYFDLIPNQYADLNNYYISIETHTCKKNIKFHNSNIDYKYKPKCISAIPLQNIIPDIDNLQDKSIQLLEIQSDKILDFSNYNKSDFKKDKKRLKTLFNKYKKKNKIKDIPLDFNEFISYIFENKISNVNHHKFTYKDCIWWATKLIAKSTWNNKNYDKRWKKILTYLGYEVIKDDNNIIDKENSILFLTSNSYKLIDSLTNDEYKFKIENNKIFKI